MSSDAITLSAEKREITGKKVKSLRGEGFVPGTVYEKGKESVNIRVPFMPMTKVYSAAGMGQPVELTVEKKKYLTMIKDVHIDPVKNTIVHVAFHAVNKNDPVEAEIAVHIEGDVPAEQTGNFVVKPNDVVKVKALPADLPESFTLSAESLQNPGDTLTVADIAADAKVEILSEPETILAVVEEPRAAEEPEEAEAVDAADVPSENGGDSSEAASDNGSEEKSE